MSRHDMKMTKFRVASMACWVLAFLFMFWPLFAPADVRPYFFLTFLFLAIAIAMGWFDTRAIAINVLSAVGGTEGPRVPR
ncbi:MAG: hypothetical protein ACE5QF_02820 [Thermoplasmata archaeon]